MMKLRISIALCFLIQDIAGSGFEGSSGCAEGIGHMGRTRCIRQSQYNTYQWAQCLTDEYIQVLTNGSQGCRQLKGMPTNLHCTLPCMYHMYGKTEGNVVVPCGCDPTSTNSSTGKYTPELTMEPKCHNTQVVDCTFYKDCVRKYYLCKDSQFKDFLRYGEGFCSLTSHESSFSLDETKAWLAAGRLCLQTELIQWLESGLCSEFLKLIRKKQKHCLTFPDSKDVSAILCNLGTADWNRMFWTIRGAEPADTSEALKTVWETTQQCLPNLAKITVHPSYTDSTRLVRFIVDFPTSAAVTQGSPSTRDDDAHVKTLLTDVSKPMKWNEMGVVWFAFASFSNSSLLFVDVLISTRKVNDLNAPASVPSVNLNETVHDLAGQIRAKTISFHKDFGGSQIDYLVCTDDNCEKVDLRVSQSVPRAPVSAAVAVAIWYGMTLLLTGISSIVWNNLLWP